MKSWLPAVALTGFAWLCACSPQASPSTSSSSANAPRVSGAAAEPPALDPTATATAPPADEAAPLASSTASTASTAAAPSEGATTTLFVREKRVDCEGEGPMKCLHVRESASAPWRLLYVPIEGLQYEEGTAYELRVETRATPAAPQGGSTSRYRLVEIVAKKKVAGKP